MIKRNVINPQIISYMAFFDNFTCKEFLPSCTEHDIYTCLSLGFFDNVLKLFSILDEFRTELGFPIIVSSSYRSFNHNRSVGGSPTSDHLTGCAVDFKCPDMPFDSLIIHFTDFLIKSGYENVSGQIIYYHKRKFIHYALTTPKHKTISYLHYEQRDN